jgi:hypothetical protein
LAGIKLTSSELPNWPRLLSLPLAAAYVGISEGLFRRGVEARVWPRPIRFRRRKLWDRRMLDAKVDALSNLITAPEPSPEPPRQPIETFPPAPKRKHVLR